MIYPLYTLSREELNQQKYPSNKPSITTFLHFNEQLTTSIVESILLTKIV
jgi:hypothetical protein